MNKVLESAPGAAVNEQNPWVRIADMADMPEYLRVRAAYLVIEQARSFLTADMVTYQCRGGQVQHTRPQLLIRFGDEQAALGVCATRDLMYLLPYRVVGEGAGALEVAAFVDEVQRKQPIRWQGDFYECGDMQVLRLVLRRVKMCAQRDAIALLKSLL